MKKLLIGLAAVLLLLAAVFFWKGGHHALYLADQLEEWVDADDGAAAVTIQFQQPDYTVDPENGKITPQVGQLSLNGDVAWTEYADEPLFSLHIGQAAAYLRKGVVCFDSGRAYALPDLSGRSRDLGKLRTGLLLYGRVTKEGDTYTISMDTGELELTVQVTVDKAVRAISFTALLPDEAAVTGSVVPKAAESSAIPQPVLDALVLSEMEPPMALSSLLDTVLPAMQRLLPLSGELTLGVDCGLLELSESAQFRMNGKKAELERSGVIVAFDLPEEFSGADPAALALLLLRNGEFTLNGADAVVSVTLPPDVTGEICTALVPQIEHLGMTYGDSSAVLTITGGRLSAVSMHTSGEVPFVLTTIPLSFSADLMIP